MYIGAVATSAVLELYLQHDFCNVIFKIKLHTASGVSSPFPSGNGKLRVGTSRLPVNPRIVTSFKQIFS